MASAAFAAPEGLTASDGGDGKRSAKAVLERAGGKDAALEMLAAMPLDDLKARSGGTGLAEYLCSVRCGLGRLVADHLPPSGTGLCPAEP